MTSTLDPANVAAVAAEAFTRVWRTSLDQPGFAVMRFARPVDSHELRRAMLALADAFPVRFVVERLGRFDQQVSSKFHRDGAPPASLLLLGYEPTTVRSRLFVADSSRAAAEAGMPLAEFLAKFNPMFPAGEAKYFPFVTELELPHGEAFVVAINNSLLPTGSVEPRLVPSCGARQEGPRRQAGDGNPLGLLHKALIEVPDPTARRVINSLGLTPEGWGAAKTPEEFEWFHTREDLD